MLAKVYQRIAEQTVESLFEDRLDLDRLLPELYREMRSRADTIGKSGDDYDAGDLNWALDQEREAKLQVEGLADAIAELQCAISQSIPSDGQIIIRHMKSATATLRNLKRRMNAV